MTELETAIQIAVKAHSGQTDKNHQPYILHPLRVMLACTTDVEKTVAVLHDVLEDSACTPRTLQDAGISQYIIDAVWALTKAPNEDYLKYLERLSKNPLATAIKIEDIRDNANPIRLCQLDCKTIDRLTAKYMIALKYLL